MQPNFSYLTFHKHSPHPSFLSFLVPYSLFLVPCSLFLVPCSSVQLLTPPLFHYSIFPVRYSIFAVRCPVDQIPSPPGMLFRRRSVPINPADVSVSGVCTTKLAAGNRWKILVSLNDANVPEKVMLTTALCPLADKTIVRIAHRQFDAGIERYFFVEYGPDPCSGNDITTVYAPEPVGR
jgi:hypothetical protein